VCASPELFAAYRGLPRLRVPRHPPHALVRLTTSSGTKQSTRDFTKRVTKRHFSFGFAFPNDLHLPSVVKQRNNRVEILDMEACDKSLRTFEFACAISTRFSGKEVIQPQVPLRLPCYDFAPVTRLAFGGLALLRGSDTDFGRSELPWRDGRCVQGPGTYSPWRS
jgi:hypothetical protein